MVSCLMGDSTALASAIVRCCLKNLGNIKWIAQDIFVHYNTAVYRIKDIQRKSGCDLSNSEDRFRLELAFRLYQSIGHQEMPDTRK